MVLSWVDGVQVDARDVYTIHAGARRRRPRAEDPEAPQASIGYRASFGNQCAPRSSCGHGCGHDDGGVGDEPWRYALGPGGHYYDKCAPTISASCFRNTPAPRERFVVERVYEGRGRYPSFCGDRCGGCGGDDRRVEGTLGYARSCGCGGGRRDGEPRGASRGEVLPPVSTVPYEEWRKATLSAESLRSLK